MAGIYTDFGHYRVPDRAELKSALEKASVTVDANVMLDLYRGSDAYTSNMMVALRWLNNRLFVTHQAMREFWRNRTSVLEDRTKAKLDIERALGSANQTLRQAFRQWGNRTQMPETDMAEIVKLLESFVEGSRDLVSSFHVDDTENYPAPSEDPILQELESVLEGRVVGPLAASEWSKRVSEGIRRHGAGIAPGFKEKAADKEHLPEKVAGDYLVWSQACDIACEASTPLVVITRDQKEDWWWREKGAFLGPNRDLVEEFNGRSGGQVYLMTPQDFLRLFAELNHTQLPEDAFDAGSQDDELTSDDPLVGSEPEQMVADTGRSEWTLEGYEAVIASLEYQGSKQAAVIAAAVANDGSISRESVYEICEFEPTRMLRGFTKPVARHTRMLQKEGKVPPGVRGLLLPAYDFGPTANRWVVPDEVVRLVKESA
ncbi:PIN-like domain-containing protein [Paenarthrobacter aurescens]|uniref:PIN like domain-containing protein n=1 Tax=Paenarthrobacter aurescens TaxID=43663 RepID=A0A4Y3NKQ9_PAEAU|nr:PIN-like domain-containing protein [Paenarthrobacter aurescens]MDO6145188.1 hypothetical protein [Paenarthrobacter aurescens]MDO6149033.1 hypothetical protein [Paenarthrobacter aurescens]MDO6160279.1 hypothetical protein [Paenarthrobacter aurescens]MDO6164138.1 hypothetical protein [Paenarthrobacter aurescens]GEB21045.1 hypothetical protein AAU01_38000 [Paenarthrobacter aurescens]